MTPLIVQNLRHDAPYIVNSITGTVHCPFVGGSQMDNWVSKHLLPSGRLPRGEYLSAFGLSGVPFAVAVAASSAVNMHSFGLGQATTSPLSLFHFILAPGLLLTAWLAFCAMSKRLHDMGRSAAWLVAPVALLVAGCWAMSFGDRRSFYILLTIFGFFLTPVLFGFFGLILAAFGSDGPNKFDATHNATAAARPSLARQQPAAAAAPQPAKIIEVFLRPSLRIDAQGFRQALFVSGALSFVFSVAASVVVLLITKVAIRGPAQMSSTLLIMAIVYLPLYWSQFCLFANRLHDLDLKAWWLAAPAMIYFVACAVVSLGDPSVLQETAKTGRFVLLLGYLGLGAMLAFRNGRQDLNQFGPPRSLAWS